METDMTTRRGFLATALATALVPRVSWADAGAPDYLAAARMPDGAYRLFGLDEGGTAIFSVPLPDRGHAAAAHPVRPEAVAFARRPGTFAVVLDCASGRDVAALTAPEGRHFYGHGAFSRDGSRLFTTENDLATGAGRLGIWAADDGYARLGEIASGGEGPHDVARLPGSDILVVANGGIETHPDTGRTPLNLATMRPNLAYLAPDGGVLARIELEPPLRLNSIRHLTLRGDGLVAFAMQWQGDGPERPPLLGLHRRGHPPRLVQAPEPLHGRMQNYAGSICFSGDGSRVAISSPRGGLVQVFDTETGAFADRLEAPDVCGLNACGGGFVASTGTGLVTRFGTDDAAAAVPARHAVNWDNHLIRVQAAA
jgi:uncharacterized protein